MPSALNGMRRAACASTSCRTRRTRTSIISTKSTGTMRRWRRIGQHPIMQSGARLRTLWMARPKRHAARRCFLQRPDTGSERARHTVNAGCSVARRPFLPRRAQQQLADPLGLFLLHPMPCTVDQVATEHAGASALLHAFEIAGTLIGAPVALAGNEDRRHVDGAARE